MTLDFTSGPLRPLSLNSWDQDFPKAMLRVKGYKCTKYGPYGYCHFLLEATEEITLISFQWPWGPWLLILGPKLLKGIAGAYGLQVYKVCAGGLLCVCVCGGVCVCVWGCVCVCFLLLLLPLFFASGGRRKRLEEKEKEEKEKGTKQQKENIYALFHRHR